MGNWFLSAIEMLEKEFYEVNKEILIHQIPSEKGYGDLSQIKASLSNTSYKSIDDALATLKDKIKENSWENDGKLEIKNLKVKYLPSLDYVLRGVSVSINPGESIGVVGRTGAGKSTLFKTVAGVFEEYKGSIKIGGKELGEIELKQLRRSISIVPQDPHIFNDSIRTNLDPTGIHSDEKIIKILEEIKLWNRF